MKRSVLERVLGILASGETPVFTPWDVHRALPDDAIGGFEPAAHGAGRGYLAWSRAAEAAFDGDELTQPLGAHFAGPATALQMAFAAAGLTVRVDLDEEADPVYGARGTLVVPPDARRLPCDLRRVVEAFRALSRDHVVALPCAGFTRSDGWSDVAEHAHDDDQTACFWTEQGHDAFDAVGALTRPLHLYWRGDAARIAAALRAHGFSVREPESEDRTIEVSATTPSTPFVPRFADVLPGEPRLGTRPAAVAVRGGGPLVVTMAAASPEKKPVRALALAPAADDSASRLAVCHRDDLRGSPEHALVVLEASGAVVAAPERREHARPACLGARFLDERRLLVCWEDYLPATACTPRAQAAARVDGPRVGGRRVVSRPTGPVRAATDPISCVALDVLDLLHLDDPAKRRTLRVFPVSPSVRGLGVTRDGRLAAIASPDGAVLLDVESGTERACVGGPPTDTYPALALSPDGALVAWTSDAGPLVVVTGADGVVRSRFDALLHPGPRGFRDLAFDPGGRVLALLCRRIHRGPGDERVESSLEIFDVATGERAWRAVEAASNDAHAFAFHPTKPVVAFGFGDGSAALVDVPSGAVRARVPLLDGAVTAICFSEDGARFAAGDANGRVCVGHVQPG